MNIILKLVLNTVAVLVAAYLVPGIVVADIYTAVIVAVVLGIANMFIKPVLHLISLPLTILTLGLFALVINGLVVLLVAMFVPDFEVGGLFSAILFSLVISLVSAFFNSLT